MIIGFVLTGFVHVSYGCEVLLWNKLYGSLTQCDTLMMDIGLIGEVIVAKMSRDSDSNTTMLELNRYYHTCF